MSAFKKFGGVIPYGLGDDLSSYLTGHIHQLYTPQPLPPPEESCIPLGGIIPYGLGHTATSYIIGHIHELYICSSSGPPQPPSTRGSGGGSRPYAPGEIQTFYKPVHTKYLVPWKSTTIRNKIVKIKVIFADVEKENQYIVPQSNNIVIRPTVMVQKNAPTIKALWNNSPYRAWAKPIQMAIVAAPQQFVVIKSVSITPIPISITATVLNKKK